MPVQVTVSNQLNKIIADLERVKKQATEVGNAFSDASNEVEENLERNTKRTETFFGQLRNISRRVADGLRRDFKSLLSLNALTDAMKISNQFRNAVSSTVELSDTIRRLGPVFGLASKDFATFQAKLASGLGEIGLSADTAAKTLLGLSETQVRGDENLLGYSRTAGMLASVGGEKGQEGQIAKQIANVIQARGGNVNDQKQVDALAESLRRSFNATGMAPTQVLGNMERIFQMMPKDLRKAIDDSGLANLAAASAVGGPNSMKFFEEYFSKSTLERLPIDAQGGAGLINNKGFDFEKLKGFLGSITSRINSDPRAALKTLGITDEAAEGLVRLSENIDKVKEKQDLMAKSAGSLAGQFDETKSLFDAFTSNINRVSKELSGITAPFTQKLTSLLVQASKSDTAASGVTAGAAVGAAALAGFGLSGILGRIGGPFGKILGAGGSALTTAAKGTAAESLLGEKTIPVYVVNAGEIGGGMGLPGLVPAAGGAGIGMLGTAGLVALGGVIAYQLAEFGLSKTEGEDPETKFKGDWLERLFLKVNGFLSEDGGLEGEMKDRSEAQKFELKEIDRRNKMKNETPEQRKKRWEMEDRGAKDAEGATMVASPGERARYQQEVKVTVESKDPKLKVTSTTRTRGASN